MVEEIPSWLGAIVFVFLTPVAVYRCWIVPGLERDKKNEDAVRRSDGSENL